MSPFTDEQWDLTEPDDLQPWDVAEDAEPPPDDAEPAPAGRPGEVIAGLPDEVAAGLDTAGLRERAETVLRALAGEHATLRDDQWRAIEALVSARSRVLVVQRTGWGKSAVYFVATALLRAAGAGPTVIVSPLLALMRNQIQAASRAGLAAETVNSTNVDDWTAIQERVAAGTVDLLLVSPERLNNPDFRDGILPRLAATTGLLVVDEAHCVSDWGHDFRPDYRRIRQFLADLPAGVPVLATTATANARVVTDVAGQLGADALVLRGPLDRESLRLAVVELPSYAERLGWLDERLTGLAGSGIIYTLTVAAANEVAGHLRERGHNVAAYSGQTDPAERLAIEDGLLSNALKAVVATSALGMGFDKPDLSFVVHLGAPSSPVAYYQQIGRAGRATAQADVVLLPGRTDADIWRYFASLAFPPEPQVRAILAALTEAGRPLSTAVLQARVDLRQTRLETVLKVLDVDGAVRRVKGGWVATGEDWTYDTERYAGVAAARRDEQDAMRGYIATAGCRMEYLRTQLDDPGAAPCGRCDRCAEPAWATTVDEKALAAARSRLEQPGVVLDARAQWPAGMAALDVSLSGRIAADERAGSGRALARLSEPGWGDRMRELLAGPDGEVSDAVVAGIVTVLAGWEWAERPTVVVDVASRRRPVLVRSLAGRIATVGRLRYGGTVERVAAGERGGRANSAQRLAMVDGAFAVPAGMDVTGATVLLVDDVADTRWTLTVVARLLRQAGATAVLPLVLAVEG